MEQLMFVELLLGIKPMTSVQALGVPSGPDALVADLCGYTTPHTLSEVCSILGV